MNKTFTRMSGGWFLAAAMYMPLLASAQEVLGTAQSFAVLAGSAVTNTGGSTVTGDLGVAPGTAITGFPPGLVSGVQHASDAVALQAQADVTTAYNVFAGAAFNSNLTGTDLAGLTLTPGTYRFATSAQLTGTVTLDAQGDPGAVFIFQVGSTLISASAAAVTLVNGAQACNVFWKVGSSATLGTGTAFAGNILALTSITLNHDATLLGRALARNGSVTMDTNAVAKPACAAGPPASILVSVAFAPNSIMPGGTATLTITFTNISSTAATLTAPFVDTLPAGVTVAGAPGASTTCAGSGALFGAPGDSSAGLGSGYSIAPNGSCTFSVQVTAQAGTYVDIIDAGAVESTGGSNGFSSSATLHVSAFGAGGPATPVPLMGNWLVALLGAMLGLLGMSRIRAS